MHNWTVDNRNLKLTLVFLQIIFLFSHLAIAHHTTRSVRKYVPALENKIMKCICFIYIYVIYIYITDVHIYCIHNIIYIEHYIYVLDIYNVLNSVAVRKVKLC